MYLQPIRFPDIDNIKKIHDFFYFFAIPNSNVKVRPETRDGFQIKHCEARKQSKRDKQDTPPSYKHKVK